jgi:ABC-type branched-subunit amino acid transport system substrate-binding protein
MLRWFSCRRSAFVATCLVAASLALSSCDTLRRTTGLPGEAERRQATAPPKPVVAQPPPAAPAAEAVPESIPPLLQEAEAALDQPVKVALLLPLSGSLANLGKAMSDAAQMAMFDLADRRFELIPIDDKGTANGSVDAARKAIAEGAQLILGPLLASSVRAITPLATEAAIPVIAFSSDRTVTSRGIYIIGFTPETEVERVVRFAASRGLSRFAALAPDNLYGAAVVDSLRKTAAASGATVVRVLLYEANTQNFSPLVRRLTAVTEATSDDAPFEAMLPPLPAFDSLLLAEGGTQLRTMTSALEAIGVRSPGVQLLGTGKWDEPSIGTHAELVGAWFAAPVPANREEFNVRYKRTFGQTAPRLATLAYDATALAAVLARGPERNPFAEASLTDPNGFFGRDGLFRLNVDGTVDRKLAIIEVQRGGLTVIDEPPRSFAAGS